MAQVAFLGTGLLGSGIIERMLQQGQDVIVWNRSATQDGCIAGAWREGSGDARGRRRWRVICSHGPRRRRCRGWRARPCRPAPRRECDRHRSHTTSPAGTKARFARAAAHGLNFLHAPVFMTPQMCREGTGLMLVSGSQRVFDAVKDRLAVMTGDIWYQGERPELAAALKIFGNSMIFVLTAGIADVFGMAANLGVPLAGGRRILREVSCRRSRQGPRGEDGVGRSHGDVRVGDGAQGHATHARSRRVEAARGSAGDRGANGRSNRCRPRPARYGVCHSYRAGRAGGGRIRTPLPGLPALPALVNASSRRARR